MLRAYRRCDEKRFIRIEILHSILEMKGEPPTPITTLHRTTKRASTKEVLVQQTLTA